MASTTSVTTSRPPMAIDAGKVSRDMAVRRVGKVLTLKLAPLTAYFFLWAPIVLLVLRDRQRLGAHYSPARAGNEISVK